MSVAVIGDVHGCYYSLVTLIENFMGQGHEICLVGDLIDRGLMSRQVVRFVRDNNIKCVKGNHEYMCSILHHGWPNNGGQATLNSYEGYPEEFAEDILWMKQLPLYLEFPDVVNKDGRSLIVSHTGIEKSIEYSLENNRILWNRNKQTDWDKTKFNVFGHTAVEKPIIDKYYANIDTGCVYNAGVYNRLTALLFPEMYTIRQPNIDNTRDELC